MAQIRKEVTDSRLEVNFTDIEYTPTEIFFEAERSM